MNTERRRQPTFLEVVHDRVGGWGVSGGGTVGAGRAGLDAAVA